MMHNRNRWGMAGLIFLTLFFCLSIMAGCSKNPAQKKADHLQRAQKYVKAEKYKEARIEYLNVVQIDPKDAKAHYQLGEVYLKLQQPKQAVREFYNAVTLDPEMAAANLKLAGFYLLAGKYDESMKKVQLVLAKEPTDIEALMILGHLHARNGALEEAEKAYLQALNQDPERMNIHIILGNFYGQQRKFEQAFVHLKKAVSLDTKGINASLALARMYIIAGKKPAARQLYESLVDKNPGNKGLRMVLVNFYISQFQDFQKAEATLQDMVLKSPEDVDAMLMMGDFYQKVGKTDQALSTFKQAVKADAKSEPARLKLAELYLDQKQTVMSDA